MTITPVKIRFTLISNMIFPANKPIIPPQLDGVLGFAWAKLNGFDKTPAELIPENIVLPELPFELIDGKFYAASAGFAAPDSFFCQTIFNKNADLVNTYTGPVSGQILNQTSVGCLKSDQPSYWQLSTEYVDFYARVTDIPKLYELLEIIYDIGTLGAKKSVRAGAIYGYDITETETDYSILKNGIPTRTIPVTSTKYKPPKYQSIDYCAYRPPFWNPLFHEPCYVPPPDFHLPCLNFVNQDKTFLKEALERFNESEDYKTKKAQELAKNQKNPPPTPPKTSKKQRSKTV